MVHRVENTLRPLPTVTDAVQLPGLVADSRPLDAGMFTKKPRWYEPDLSAMNPSTRMVASYYVAHEHRPSTIISPDGTYALFAAGEMLQIWDLGKAVAVHNMTGSFGAISAGVFLRDSATCTLRKDTQISTWDLKNGKEMSQTLPSADVSAIALASSRNLAAFAYDNGQLSLRNTDTGLQLASFTADAPLNCCALTADGLTVVTGDKIGTVHFVRLEPANANP